MHLSEHEKRCQNEFGDPYTNVHVFLDQFARKYNMAMAHRMILHHRLGVEVVGLEFGPDAQKAARLHIRDDLGKLLPTGPEWFLTQELYLPHSGQEDSIAADMEALLGYAPDFNTKWGMDWPSPWLKCPCGYQGPPPNGQNECPWCDVPKTERFASLVQKLRR